MSPRLRRRYPLLARQERRSAYPMRDRVNDVIGGAAMFGTVIWGLCNTGVW